MYARIYYLSKSMCYIIYQSSRKKNGFPTLCCAANYAARGKDGQEIKKTKREKNNSNKR